MVLPIHHCLSSSYLFQGHLKSYGKFLLLWTPPELQDIPGENFNNVISEKKGINVSLEYIHSFQPESWLLQGSGFAFYDCNETLPAHLAPNSKLKVCKRNIR